MAFTYGAVTHCKLYNGNTKNVYECRLGYEVQSQSIANNSSVIKLQLEVRSVNSSYYTYGYNQTTTIDGTALAAAKFDMRSTNTWQVFGTREITVNHNIDGTYSATKSGSFVTTANTSYSLRSGSASVTVAPATIPRYATSNQSLAGKSSSSIAINWSSDSTIDYIWYSKDNGASWTGLDVADGTSGSYNITGLSANTTYNIKTRVRRKDSQLTTDSGTLTVTTYQTTIAYIAFASKTETTITVNSSSNVNVSRTQYRIAKVGQNYGGWQSSNTFTGLQANTSYIVQVEKVASESGEANYATTGEITTYDYAKPLSINDFTIGEGATVYCYNPLGRQITVEIISNINGQSMGHYSGTISGERFYIHSEFHTAEAIAKQYASIPDAREGTYYAKVTTHLSTGNVEKTLGNAKYYANQNDCTPQFNDFSYRDTNGITTNLTGSNQILVNGYSNLLVSISTANKAAPKNSASIRRYRLNVGNMSSVEANYEKSKEVTMAINRVNSPTITVTAIDSREYSKPVPKTAIFKAYYRPIITAIAAARENGGVGTQVNLSIQGRWWNENFGSVQNSIKSVKYYYKTTTSGSWIAGATSITLNTNGHDFYGTAKIEGPSGEDKGFDVSTAYNIKLIVEDELDVSSEYQTILGSGTPAIAVFGSAVAINQMYDENDTSNKLQVNGGLKAGFGTFNQIRNYGNYYWKNHQNFVLTPDGNDAEFSFDIGSNEDDTASSYTGAVAHFWSARNKAIIASFYNDDCSVHIPNGSLLLAYDMFIGGRIIAKNQTVLSINSTGKGIGIGTKPVGDSEEKVIETDYRTRIWANLELRSYNGEGGELQLHAADDRKDNNGYIIDSYGNQLRIFGIASADGTSRPRSWNTNIY